MIETVLQEPLTEFTAEAKVDIYWTVVDENTTITETVIARWPAGALMRGSILDELGHLPIDRDS